jgi:hypothetical protein
LSSSRWQKAWNCALVLLLLLLLLMMMRMSEHWNEANAPSLQQRWTSLYLR